MEISQHITLELDFSIITDSEGKILNVEVINTTTKENMSRSKLGKALIEEYMNDISKEKVKDLIKHSSKRCHNGNTH